MPRTTPLRRRRGRLAGGRLRLLGCALILATIAWPVPESRAAYRGRNGEIGFVSADLEPHGGPYTDATDYAVEPNGSHRQELPAGGETAEPALFSPSGRQLVFERVTRTDGEDSEQVFTSALPYHPLPVFTALTADDLRAGAPAWSPSGRRIAFAVSGTSSAYGEPSGTYVMNADGRDAVRISALVPTYIAWSSRSRLALLTAAGIVTLQPNGSHARMLGRQADLHGTVDFSPDGTRLVYDRAGHVFVSRADGSHPRRIATHGFEPVFSPDGTEIAYVRADRGAHGRVDDLWVMRADGADQHMVHREPYDRLAEHDVSDVAYPDWQPLPVRSRRLRPHAITRARRGSRERAG